MATQHTYLKTHALSGRELSFSLSKETAALSERAAASRSGRAAKTLVKQGSLRTTLVALRKGAELAAHRVDGDVAIQVLRGRARVSAGDADTTLGSGALLVLGRNVTHAAEALSDATLLITVAMPDAAG